jgi:hypothetical protein
LPVGVRWWGQPPSLTEAVARCQVVHVLSHWEPEWNWIVVDEAAILRRCLSAWDWTVLFKQT